MIGRVAALVLLCMAMLPAHAHTLSVAHVDVVLSSPGKSDAKTPGNGSPTIDVDLALRDLALTFPLDANRDDAITWGELSALRPQLERWAADGITLSVAGRDCPLTSSLLGIRRYDDGAYAALRMQARCSSDGPVRLHYGLFFDRDPQHRALITAHQGDSSTSAIARKGDAAVQLSLQGGQPPSPFLDYLREGVHHILIGYDHLAFLISLLLPAALVRVRREWQPAPSLRSSFLHVLGLVTAFTVAHSVTLSLAALGWITPASRPVEAAIAASVLLAALNNLWPVVTTRVWMVAFGFGLIHGFGFAGALSELGLPASSRLLALLGFNLGVELGQLAVVCLLLPVLFALRHRKSYAGLAMPILSLAIAGLAAWWLFERLRG